MTTHTNARRDANAEAAFLEFRRVVKTMQDLQDGLDDASLALHYAVNKGQDSLPVTAKDLAGTRKRIEAAIAQITGDAVQAAVNELRS
jgi:hypothetical protein